MMEEGGPSQQGGSSEIENRRLQFCGTLETTQCDF